VVGGGFGVGGLLVLFLFRKRKMTKIKREREKKKKRTKFFWFKTYQNVTIKFPPWLNYDFPKFAVEMIFPDRKFSHKATLIFRGEILRQ